MESTPTSIAQQLKRRKIASEPDWLTGDVGKYLFATKSEKLHGDKDGLAPLPVQQSDLLKPVYMDIVQYGLNYAYLKYHDVPWTPSYIQRDDKRYTKTSKPRKVIVVGAGMAGLSAAYELAQAGHQVQILEMQERVGGRVKTFGEKEGFAKHLYVDGGAMRLPNKKDCTEKTHFLTDYYTSNVFKLPLAKFNNADDDAFLKFYNEDAMTYRDWVKNPDGKKDGGDYNFSKNWNGWDKRIIETGAKAKLKITGIDDYYSCTSKIVTDQLRKHLAGKNSEQASKEWEKWIDNWCRFPLNGFLRSKAEEVKMKLDEDYRDIDLTTLEKLLPWPEVAITAYSVFNYTEQLDQSLVQFLRDELGVWWSKHMHHIDGGMSKLPESFTKENIHGWNKEVHLEENITFNVTVDTVKYTSPTSKGEDQKVIVGCYYTTSGQPCEFEGNAVIITTPLHIVRQIKFVNGENTAVFPRKFYQALEDIWYGPSTKIMIQTKTRFWEQQKIQGGFSKTNLPIGQIHYPTKVHDPKSEKGILLVYTWKSEALLFGSLKPQVAIKEAVRQIATIHPEVEEQFEVGAIQAWYNDPSAQGAYVLLKPEQYRNVRDLMHYPWRNVFFAGEGLSFTAGWIQGALESGLRAAYQFYSRNEEDRFDSSAAAIEH